MNGAGCEAVIEQLVPGGSGRPATLEGGAVPGPGPPDGRRRDRATTVTDADGTARIWGIAANVALIALVSWCVIAAAFITWVVKARQRRARNRIPRGV